MQKPSEQLQINTSEISVQLCSQKWALSFVSIFKYRCFFFFCVGREMGAGGEAVAGLCVYLVGFFCKAGERSFFMGKK